jgi:hypothetical protein
MLLSAMVFLKISWPEFGFGTNDELVKEPTAVEITAQINKEIVDKIDTLLERVQSASTKIDNSAEVSAKLATSVDSLIDRVKELEQRASTSNLAIAELGNLAGRRDTCKYTRVLDSVEKVQEVLRTVQAFVDTRKILPFPIEPRRKGHRLFDALGPVVNPCVTKEPFGTGDEEKWFCVSHQLMQEGCSVWSIGSNNQWEFEKAMAARTPCKIHTFDCTLENGFQPPSEIVGRSTQYPYCLGSSSSSERQNFRDLQNITALTGGRADFFKMDIEDFEWEVLRNMLDVAAKEWREHGNDIFPEQIAVEVHYFKDQGEEHFFCLMSSMFLEGGYVLAHRRDNVRCSSCSEVLFVRARCTILPPARSECANYF